MAMKPERPLMWITNFPVAEINSREVIFIGGTVKEPMPVKDYSSDDLARMGYCGVYAEPGRACVGIHTRPPSFKLSSNPEP